MINIIIQNLGTIVMSLIITCIAVVITIKIIRDKKNGKCTGCDCGNGECPKGFR